jgi:site-specific DNA-methyltransferase (adenine-specific)
MSKDWVNQLWYGDCLSIMNEMPKDYVDLVYLDPPFNSNREYAAIYEDDTGRPLPEQIDAFEDLWELSEERLRAIEHMPVLMRAADIPDDVAQFWSLWMRALRKANPRLLAYLSYMTERLLPLRSIVKPTGSIYLHCDPTASHYIKAMMDAVFDHDNFRNEIIWKRTHSHGDPKRKYGAITDTILFYTMSNKYTFHPQYRRHADAYVEKTFSNTDPDGRKWQSVTLRSPSLRPNLIYPYTASNGLTYQPHPNGWSCDITRLRKYDREGRLHFPAKADGALRLKMYIDESKGLKVQNLWDDIPPISANAKERLGYPTQKPVALLERIIAASSDEGQIVLDPFCGCASTIEAAHRLNRRWIGIDVAIHAIRRVAAVRLQDRLGLKEDVDFVVRGIPQTVEGAKELWTHDKHQFQKWAIEQVDGFVTAKKTADGGIDGRLYFYMPGQNDLESMVIEVKGGKNVNVEVVRSLRGTVARDQALMAGLIVMDDLGDRKTKNFHREMADAGDLDVGGIKYSRMQMLTVGEILAGKRFLTPTVAKAKMVSQPSLPLGR